MAKISVNISNLDFSELSYLYFEVKNEWDYRNKRDFNELPPMISEEYHLGMVPAVKAYKNRTGTRLLLAKWKYDEYKKSVT